jgi:hypothetical protein
MSQIEKIDGVYLFDRGRGVICGDVFGSADDVDGADGLIVSIIAGSVQDDVGQNTRCQIGRVVNPRPYERQRRGRFQISDLRFQIGETATAKATATAEANTVTRSS